MSRIASSTGGRALYSHEKSPIFSQKETYILTKRDFCHSKRAQFHSQQVAGRCILTKAAIYMYMYIFIYICIRICI